MHSLTTPACIVITFSFIRRCLTGTKLELCWRRRCRSTACSVPLTTHLETERRAARTLHTDALLVTALLRWPDATDVCSSPLLLRPPPSGWHAPAPTQNGARAPAVTLTRAIFARERGSLIGWTVAPFRRRQTWGAVVSQVGGGGDDPTGVSPPRAEGNSGHWPVAQAGLPRGAGGR